MVCHQKNQASDWPTYLVYQLEAYFFCGGKTLELKSWLIYLKKPDFGCVALPWHFEFYILKCKKNFCKIFLIDFLDELGNFKHKKNLHLKM